MDKKTTGIIAYISVIGLIIALVAGDREGARFHINQSLVILLFGFLVLVPYIGRLWAIFIMVCWTMGIISAAQEEEKSVPLIGGIQLIK